MSQDKKEKSFPLRKDGLPRESAGSGQMTGRSFKGLEGLKDTAFNKTLTDMLMAPGPNYDPGNPDSLFWAVGRKFTADLKVQFLQATAKIGRVGLAAHAVGISPSCVLEHRKKDKRFDDLVRDAESFYKESCAAVIMQQARDGHLERKWNANGQLISERRVYETQLRLKLLEWCDPSFNQAQKQEITVRGGAVMVPGPVDSTDNWNDVLASLNELEAAQAKQTAEETSKALGQAASEQHEPSEDDPDSLDAFANGRTVYTQGESADESDE